MQQSPGPSSDGRRGAESKYAKKISRLQGNQPRIEPTAGALENGLIAAGGLAPGFSAHRTQPRRPGDPPPPPPRQLPEEEKWEKWEQAFRQQHVLRERMHQYILKVTREEQQKTPSEERAAQIRRLEEDGLILRSLMDPDAVQEPFFRVVYRFPGSERVFFRPPGWVAEGGGRGYVLKADPISIGAEHYLLRTKALAFVVFKSYAEERVDGPPTGATGDVATWAVPDPVEEGVYFVSEEMRAAVREYLGQQPGYETRFPSLDLTKVLTAPYLFWYRSRGSYQSSIDGVSPCHQALVAMFAEWIDTNHGDEYTHVAGGIEGLEIGTPHGV